MPAQIKPSQKEFFKEVRSIEPIYTGGKISVSPDEQWLFTSLGEEIQITELETGRSVKRLKGDTEVITTFCISLDSKYLITCSQSNLMRTYALPSFDLLRTQKAHDAPVFVSDVDASCTLCATGSADSVIRIWDIEKGFATHNFRGHTGRISALKFHPNKHRWTLISGAEDAHVRIWDLMKKQCVAVLESHVSVIRGLDVTPDGDTLISGSRDQVVNVWNLTKNKLSQTIPIYETIETVGFAKDNSDTFYTGGEKGQVRLWDLSTGQPVHEAEQGDAITDIVKLPLSNAVMVVTNEQDMYTLSLTHSKDLARMRYIVGYNDEIVDCRFLDFKSHNDNVVFDILVPTNASHHLAVATNSKTVRVYDLSRWDCQMIHGHTDTVICMDSADVLSNPSRILLATGGKDQTARVWVLDSAKDNLRYFCAALCKGHAESISALALTKKSLQYLLTASQDRTIKCWDISTINSSGKEGETIQPRSLFTQKAHDKEINAVSIAPNDKFFATASQDRTAKLWNMDGTHVGTFTGHKRSVWDVQFSAVDSAVVTGSGDKTIKVWNISDFSCLKTFEGHTNSVLRVGFLSSGTQVVSTGSDGLVKVWTIKTNECIATLDKHEDRVWGLATRSDEKVIVSAGADSLITFWEDITEQEESKKQSEMEEQIEKEQDFANFVQRKDWRNAITLAISLRQPYRLLTMFKNVIRERGDDGTLGNAEIEGIITTLSDEQLELLLTYIRDWNTNAKHSQVAHTLLRVILSHYPSSRLTSLPNIKSVLDGLLPYSERHFERMDRLTTDSYIVEYTLSGMDGLMDSM